MIVQRGLGGVPISRAAWRRQKERRRRMASLCDAGREADGPAEQEGSDDAADVSPHQYIILITISSFPERCGVAPAHSILACRGEHRDGRREGVSSVPVPLASGTSRDVSMPTGGSVAPASGMLRKTETRVPRAAAPPASRPGEFSGDTHSGRSDYGHAQARVWAARRQRPAPRRSCWTPAPEVTSHR
jgi:hypothetical protein